MYNLSMGRVIILSLAFFLAICGNAYATQQHADPEGLYSHQIAHIFFVLSMCILIYQIHRSGSTHRGWRLIKYAAFLFILWNTDTFVVHILTESLDPSAITTTAGLWSQRMDLTATDAKMIYFGKIMDHFVLVSSVFVFLKGITSFETDGTETESGQ